MLLSTLVWNTPRLSCFTILELEIIQNWFQLAIVPNDIHPFYPVLANLCLFPLPQLKRSCYCFQMLTEWGDIEAHKVWLLEVIRMETIGLLNWAKIVPIGLVGVIVTFGEAIGNWVNYSNLLWDLIPPSDLFIYIFTLLLRPSLNRYLQDFLNSIDMGHFSFLGFAAMPLA